MRPAVAQHEKKEGTQSFWQFRAFLGNPNLQGGLLAEAASLVCQNWKDRSNFSFLQGARWSAGFVGMLKAFTFGSQVASGEPAARAGCLALGCFGFPGAGLCSAKQWFPAC